MNYCGIKSESQNIIIINATPSCGVRQACAEFYLLQFKVLFLCLYVYCNLVEIIRGGSRKFREGTSPPEGPEKNTVLDNYSGVGLYKLLIT